MEQALNTVSNQHQKQSDLKANAPTLSYRSVYTYVYVNIATAQWNFKSTYVFQKYG